jgi:ABC-type multidrug transport system fused ATPase/permease subunit
VLQLNELSKRFNPLWQALSPRRRKQLLGLQLLGMLAAVGEVANLGALLPFLRLLANPAESLNTLGPLAEPLRNLPQRHLLLSLGFGFMAVVAVSTALRVLAIRSQLRLSALVTADLGERVFSVVLQRPYVWHLRTNSSAVLSYLTQDVNSVFACVNCLLLLGMNGLIVLLLASSLIALAPGVMLVVGTLLSGFYLLVFRFTRSQLRNDGAVGIREYQHAMQVAQEGLGGIRDILLDRSQATFVKAYRQSNQRRNLAQASINIKAQVPRYLIEGFAVLLIVGVALTLSLQGLGIERQLPLLGTLALGAYRLLQPLQQCFGAVSSLQANRVAVQRLAPFLASQPTPAQAIDSETLTLATLSAARTDRPLVELKNVSFRYSTEGPWVLRNLDLAIQPGERLAFVGTTGSGKSTTSDLILGLLKPSEGQLLVWGQDLHANSGLVSAWQARVAHVPQQIYLSDASFAANIAFGMSEDQIDHHRLRQAAAQARITDLIESSEDGYSTLVGERGVRLSGGQRQRIGIARALYKQAQLLVLDEATSALDNRTEAEVMAAIESLDRKITVILIAHRLSTVERCDRVVLLERGEIICCGRYEQLQANNKSFQEIAMATSPSEN